MRARKWCCSEARRDNSGRDGRAGDSEDMCVNTPPSLDFQLMHRCLDGASAANHSPAGCPPWSRRSRWRFGGLFRNSRALSARTRLTRRARVTTVVAVSPTPMLTTHSPERNYKAAVRYIRVQASFGSASRADTHVIRSQVRAVTGDMPGASRL